MGDANQNNSTIPNMFSMVKKRSRTEFEVNRTESEQDGESDWPTSALTSAATSISSLAPTFALNDLELSESTDTVVSAHQIDKEKDKLAFRLDRLNDKKCRFESHEAFLKKCIENNLVPNGLKVYVEPSIGNRDDTFLALWHERLDTFSRTLTNDVIQYCEQEVEKTKTEIAECSDRFKALVTPPVFSNISKTIETNEKTRVNELTQRKNRKFYKLKYRNDDRNPPEKRPEQREPQPRVLYSNRGHRGLGNQNRNHHSSGDESRDDEHQSDRRDRNRNTWNRYDNTHGDAHINTRTNERDRHRDSRNGNEHVNRDSRDDNERVIEVIERRTENRNYAAAVQGPSNQYRYQNQSHRHEPLHERLALAKRNSRRNVRIYDAQGESHGNTHTNNRDRNRDTRSANEETGDKEREIAALKKRIEGMERGRGQQEQVTNHYSRESDEHQKNVMEAQSAKGPGENDMTEMKTFIRGVLETISAFDKRLTARMDTNQIHLDK